MLIKIAICILDAIAILKLDMFSVIWKVADFLDPKLRSDIRNGLRTLSRNFRKILVEALSLLPLVIVKQLIHVSPSSPAW